MLDPTCHEHDDLCIVIAIYEYMDRYILIIRSMQSCIIYVNHCARYEYHGCRERSEYIMADHTGMIIRSMEMVPSTMPLVMML